MSMIARTARLVTASACLAGAALGPVLLASPALASPNGILISEFRTTGPSGGNDEFVEIANASSIDVDISGYLFQGCAAGSGAASTRATVPAGTVLTPGQRFLFTNSSGYSGTVPGDRSYGTGISDLNNNGSGLRLLDSNAQVIDGVGAAGTAPNSCREGTGINTVGVTTSFERAGGVQDTEDNAADFSQTAQAMPQNQSSTAMPPPVIPEVSAAVLLPLSALAMAGGGLALARRRALSGTSAAAI